MVDDNNDASDGNSPPRCTLVSAEEFLSRLRAKRAEKEHPHKNLHFETPEDALREFVRYTKEFVRLHEALFVLFEIQAAFIIKHISEIPEKEQQAYEKEFGRLCDEYAKASERLNNPT